MAHPLKVLKNGQWVQGFGEPRIQDDPTCVLWLDAEHYDPITDSLIDLSGNGHHAALGSVAGFGAGGQIRGRPGDRYFAYPGVGGNQASTAYQSSMEPHNGLDLRCDVVMANYASGADRTLVSRWGSSASGSSYIFTLTSSGQLRLYLTPDGSTFDSPTSSVAVPTAPGARTWLRATWNQPTNEVRFFTSPDGDTWSQLGTTQTVALVNTNPSTKGVTVGQRDGGAWPFLGQIYRAQLYDRPDGELVVEFDPNLLEDGYQLGTVSSRTGEVWTTARHTTASNSIGIVGPPGEKYLRCTATPYDTIVASDKGPDVVDEVVVEIDALWRETGATQGFGNKNGSSASGAGWMLYIYSSGNFRLFHADGLTQVDTGTRTVTGFAFNERKKVRMTHQLSTGQGTFEVQNDDGSWSIGNSFVVVPMTGYPGANTTDYRLGGLPYTPSTYPMNADVYRFRVWNDGVLVSDLNPNNDTHPYGLGPVVDDTGGTWTLNRTVVDTNDPLLLPYEGEKYLYLPRASGNYAQTPSWSRTSDDLDVRFRVDGSSLEAQTIIGSITNSFQWRVMYWSGTLRWNGSPTGSSGAQKSIQIPYSTTLTPDRVYRMVFDADGGDGGVSRALLYEGPSFDGPWTLLMSADASESWVYTKTSNNVNVGALWNNGSGELFLGSVYRAQVYDGIDGPLVLDFDPSRSVEPHTSFVAATGETWTINRSATGRKAVLVDRPILLFGTDDKLELPDALGAVPTDATWVFVVRGHGDMETDGYGVIFDTKNSLTLDEGIILFVGPPSQLRVTLSNGTTSENPTTYPYQSDFAGASRVVTMVRNSTDATLTLSVLGTSLEDIEPDAFAGTAFNGAASKVTIGGNNFTSAYTDMEFIGAAIFHRALTMAELEEVAAAFGVTP